jgi:hypothetical protein
LRCSSTIASTFPGSLPQRLRPRRDSECSRVYPQFEAVLRGPLALRRGLSALAVWHELTLPLPILPNECFDFAS